MDWNRIIRILQIISVFVGITGLTLYQFWGEKAYFIITCAAVFFILLITHIFSMKDYNVFIKKDKIDTVWEKLIKGAKQSIEIFAGDVSWINRDRDTLREITKNGIQVFVLCHFPNKNLSLQDNVRNLIESGARVKFFEKGKILPPYGLIIDGNIPQLRTALVVDRTASKKVNASQDVLYSNGIYNYRAFRYLDMKDFKYLNSLSALFSSMWANNIGGFVLGKIGKNVLTKDMIWGILKKVDLYEKLEDSDISIGNIDLTGIYSSCNYVKMDKLMSIEPIVSAYVNQDIPRFATCRCMNHDKHSILIPPILEKHNDKYVVVDGVHRLYHIYAYKGNETRAICIILENQKELPGVPFPFSDVKAAPRRLDREKVFENYRRELYRNFAPMDDYLCDASFVYSLKNAH